MSESVHQIVQRGIATAHSTDTSKHAESYHVLKSVLHHPEATPAQKVAAWLWLSQLEDEAANHLSSGAWRRFCFRCGSDAIAFTIRSIDWPPTGKQRRSPVNCRQRQMAGGTSWVGF